ncbi:hypothetical protein BHE74_00041753 [Ensete ventricosum]|nr:hypothetical protein BHE74_00041753 [Ensete ventricosum]
MKHWNSLRHRKDTRPSKGDRNRHHEALKFSFRYNKDTPVRDSSCMVPKTKGASRHMHLISKKHLTEELRRLNLRRRSWGQKVLARGNRTRRRAMDSRSECHGTAKVCLTCVYRILYRMKALVIGIISGLCSSTSQRTKPKADLSIKKKGCRCEAMENSIMGMVAPWYHRGGTSVESLIPCSHRGRALVVKRTEEVENTKANFKYQDKADGQKPGNFVRPVSIGF